MPLINFRTNLTSLRYGADRPGGGSSDQPFVQFPIEDANTPPQFRRYYEANRTGLDFPVRGGAISQLVLGESGLISSTIDRERIEKFFKSAPRGTAFIEKQKGLQLTNPRTQVPNALTFNNQQVGQLGNVFLPVTNIYASTNTLAQVQVMGTGAHFNRHGFVPTIFEAPQNTYAYLAGAPQNNTTSRNRLSILKITKLLERPSTGLANVPSLNASGADTVLAERMGISQFRDQIFNYAGGPGSVYGIGFTRIFRYTDTDSVRFSETSPDPKFTVGGVESTPYSAIALTYQQLVDAGNESNNGRVPTNPIVKDFRNYLPPTSPVPRADYQNLNIANVSNGQTGLGIGNPGQPRSGKARYIDTSTVGQDELNMLNPAASLLYYDPSTTDPWTRQGNNSKDIIKFAFECVDNSNPTVDTIALIFRAFIEGQITDTNQAEYNTFKYLGRGETFRTYQGFDRSIGFTFRMFAQSRQELLPMYTKLNQLISQVYPDYSSEYYLMRGNVVRLTIGDYLYRVPGFLENVNVTIDNTTTPWEIVLNQYLQDGAPEDDVRQLPHMVTVQCTFRPIMDILPRKVTRSSPFVPLIVNGDHFIDPTATTSTDRSKSAMTNPNPIAPQSGIQSSNPNPGGNTSSAPLATGTQNNTNTGGRSQDNNPFTTRVSNRIIRESLQNIDSLFT